MQQPIKVHKLTRGRCGSKLGRYGGDGAAVQSHPREGRVGGQGYCCWGLDGMGHEGMSGWSHRGAAASPGICWGENGRLVVVALEPEDCGAAMDPSCSRRVSVEPTRGMWLECSGS